MRVLVLTSTMPRHQFLAELILDLFPGSAAIVEPKRVQPVSESEAVKAHRDSLAEYERCAFPREPRTPSHVVSPVADVNASSLNPIALARKYDFICLFGTRILDSSWLEAFDGRIVNLHLGWSPQYRGTATLFWPFVERQLHYVGTTFHVAVARVDAGPILQQVPAALQVGDSYYDVVTRVTKASLLAFPSILTSFGEGTLQPVPQDVGLGRVFRSSDWSESALTDALDFVGSGLTREIIKEVEEQRRCLFSS